MAGLKEFEDYKYEEVEEMPKMELLNMEKELIGCFVSGHPLDDWRRVIEKCVTVNSDNIMEIAKDEKYTRESMVASGMKPWQIRNSGRTYTAIGMIQELKEIMNKKGKMMAFAKLADFKGTIDLTFFSDEWESMKDKIKVEEVYAFKGKVDPSRETPSMIVSTMEDPNELEAKSISEVHLKMEKDLCRQGNWNQGIDKIKDFLFGAQGNCVVYFHIDSEGKQYVVKADPQLTVPSDPETIQTLKDMPLVHDVWCD